MEVQMSGLIDRIKDTLHGASPEANQEQTHDHESGGAQGHADEQPQVAPPPATHEHPAEHEHNKNGHKHC